MVGTAVAVAADVPAAGAAGVAVGCNTAFVAAGAAAAGAVDEGGSVAAMACAEVTAAVVAGNVVVIVAEDLVGGTVVTADVPDGAVVCVVLFVIKASADTLVFSVTISVAVSALAAILPFELALE